MKQSDLDLEMKRLGIERQRSRVAFAQERGRESWTTYGQRMISGATKPVGDAIAEECRRADRPGRNSRAFWNLRSIDPYVAAFIGLQATLDSISRQQKASSTFIAVGKAIEFEIVAQGWSKSQPYLIRVLQRAMFSPSVKVRERSRQKALASGIGLATGEKLERLWDDAERLRVGHAVVELIRTETGLIDLVTMRTAARRTDTYVIPTQETEQYIKKVLARTELLSPVFLPMVVPPYNWTSPRSGGYERDGQDLVKTDRANILDQLTVEQMPEVYEAVNYLQGVPYRINRRILAVYTWAWENSIEIGGLPMTSDLPTPARPEPVDGDYESESHREVMREWWRQYNPIATKNLEAKGQRIHYAKLKWMAEKFQHENMFFPISLDFRGRVYTQPCFLTYQGCDAAKGLLEFAFGKPVKTDAAKRWLKVQGANSFGIKGSFEERAAWVDRNARSIIESAKDPIGCGWWREADEPWQFLAFCMDAAEIAKNPDHVSHLICWQDGSNNGLQVLSLAFRDRVGGLATNCTDDGKPRDIYQDVADRVIELLKSETREDRKEFARQWLKFGIDRSTTKRPVMIVPYSGTIYSSVRYIKDWFHEAVSPTRPSPWSDATKPIGYLTRIVWDAIGDTVVKAREAMDWLRVVGQQCMEAHIDPMWVSPSGFIVAHDYPDYRKAKVRTTVKARTCMWQIRKATDKKDKRKHLDAISPNWVHSLDSAALVKTSQRVRAAGIETFATVHDSCGVLAADGDTLAHELRLAWSEMFDTDLVGSLKRQIESMIGTRLPDPPTFGDMEPQELIGSPYFFS